jgi:EAL domain-containing protein (putative c-di-GMP-specific phosphodiesterase class I)
MADGLHFVAVALEKAGYTTELHTSLADFSQRFGQPTAAAILVDVMLDDEDAVDVLDFLKRTGTTAPVYLMSGDPEALSSASRFADEIGLPLADVITKPFTGGQILERLQQKPEGLRELFSQMDVAEAVAQGWIYPVLQPKLHLASGTIRSAELLSRMTHPDFGVVPPQKFVGQMTPEQNQTLFMQNIAHARRHFEFDPRRGNDFPIAVNVDATNLIQVRERLREIAKQSPHLYRNLLFEITEQAITDISDQQLKLLYKLKLDGARFSIDDFGTGHSNFARLSRLPVAEIKIDRSLVHGCSTTHCRQVMVRSIISMARDLGARTVAEGVETIDDLRCLQEAQCDEVQGYLIGRPMKIERFQSYVKDFNPKEHFRVS